ncbi:MAG: hypothetical protein QOD77_1554 [Thermoplasmata archaeon]|jgi:hypothetical protein|nr:hypothetical protein [Thermoplasmata archaeon]
MDLLHGAGYRAFCIVSGDSDFQPLASRLRRQGGHVELIDPPGKAPSKDADGFQAIVLGALDAAISAGQHDEGWVAVQALGERIPTKHRAATFGFAKSTPLHKVLDGLPRLKVRKTAKGHQAAQK